MSFTKDGYKLVMKWFLFALLSCACALAAPTPITQCEDAPEDIVCLAGRGRIYDSTLDLNEVR